jgi:hypothetical protein
MIRCRVGEKVVSRERETTFACTLTYSAAPASVLQSPEAISAALIERYLAGEALMRDHHFPPKLFFDIPERAEEKSALHLLFQEHVSPIEEVDQDTIGALDRGVLIVQASGQVDQQVRVPTCLLSCRTLKGSDEGRWPELARPLQVIEITATDGIHDGLRELDDGGGVEADRLIPGPVFKKQAEEFSLRLNNHGPGFGTMQRRYCLFLLVVDDDRVPVYLFSLEQATFFLSGSS